MMVFLTYCWACKAGDHSGHHKVIQAVPPGMMGGTQCRCEGECKNFPPPEALFPEVAGLRAGEGESHTPEGS